jgi:hypothetical protein
MGNRAGRQWRVPNPATIVAVIALIAAVTGTAVAARNKIKLPKNSVGTRQLKPKAATTGKIANSAVTSSKVADKSLTGDEIRVNNLPTVPAASDAAHAANTDAITGHRAACPGGTTLIRGVCFDSSPGGVAPSLQAATDSCAAKDGWLPTPAQLLSAKGILNLGTGVGSDKQFTDSIFVDEGGEDDERWTITVNGKGALERHELNLPSQYFCVYPLVR